MPNKKAGGLLETVKTVVYAVLIALLVRTFAYEPFNIPSGSMLPTLLINDYLFVSKFSYGYGRYSFPLSLVSFEGRIMGEEPERGDVAVFRNPRDTETDYIKRLVGLPGDRIQVINGVLHINGEAVTREKQGLRQIATGNGGSVEVTEYLETLPGGRQHLIWERSDSDWLDNTPEILVKEGHFFAMGDNRDASQDSRVDSRVGQVPFSHLVGRADILFFSHDGSASLFKPWTWVSAIRYGRIGSGIE